VAYPLVDVERDTDFWEEEGLRRFWGFLFHSIRLTALAATLSLLVLAGIAELFPFVEKARSAVPAEVYKGGSLCTCYCISESRPWYGTLNYWLWLGVFCVPGLVLSTGVRWCWEHKLLSYILITGACFLSMVLAITLYWEILNAPFSGLDYSLTGDMACGDMADNASKIFVVIFGWIPAFLYVGYWWLLRWLMLKGIQISGGRKA
jgi:hypothetical protein